MVQKQILDLNGFLENPNAYEKMTPADAVASIRAVKRDILAKKETDEEKIANFVTLLKKISNKSTSPKVRDEAKLAYEAIEREETKLLVPVRTASKKANIEADSALLAQKIFMDLNRPEYRRMTMLEVGGDGEKEFVIEPVLNPETENYTSTKEEAHKLDRALSTAAHLPTSDEKQKQACAEAAAILAKSDALKAEIGEKGVIAVTNALKNNGFDAFKDEYKKQLEKNGKNPDSSTFNAYLGSVEKSGIMETTTTKTTRIWHLGLGINLEFKAGTEKLFEWQDPTINSPPFQIVPLGVTVYLHQILKQWVKETERIDFSKGTTNVTREGDYSNTTKLYQMAGGEARAAFLFQNMGVIGKLVVSGDEQSMRFDFLWKEPEGGVNYLKLIQDSEHSDRILEFKGFKMSRSTPAEGIETQYSLAAIFGEEVAIAKWMKLEQEMAVRLINGNNFGVDTTLKMNLDPGAGFRIEVFGIVDHNHLDKVLRYGGGTSASIAISESFEMGVTAQYTQFMELEKNKRFGDQGDVQLNVLLTIRL